MGKSFQDLVQAATALPRAEVFRRQNRALLHLARLLHTNARVSRNRRIFMFYLWHRIDEFGRQHAEQRDVRREGRREYNALPALR